MSLEMYSKANRVLAEDVVRLSDLYLGSLTDVPGVPPVASPLTHIGGRPSNNPGVPEYRDSPFAPGGSLNSPPAPRGSVASSSGRDASFPEPVTPGPGGAPSPPKAPPSGRDLGGLPPPPLGPGGAPGGAAVPPTPPPAGPPVAPKAPPVGLQRPPPPLPQMPQIAEVGSMNDLRGHAAPQNLGGQALPQQLIYGVNPPMIPAPVVGGAAVGAVAPAAPVAPAPFAGGGGGCPNAC